MTKQLRAQEAFERYVVPELPVLLRVARALTRHDAEAEDLVQDTLVRAYRAIDSFEGRASLQTWLVRIATRVCLDAAQRQRRMPTEAPPGTAAGPLTSGVVTENRGDGAACTTPSTSMKV